MTQTEVAFVKSKNKTNESNDDYDVVYDVYDEDVDEAIAEQVLSNRSQDFGQASEENYDNQIQADTFQEGRPELRTGSDNKSIEFENRQKDYEDMDIVNNRNETHKSTFSNNLFHL